MFHTPLFITHRVVAHQHDRTLHIAHCTLHIVSCCTWLARVHIALLYIVVYIALHALHLLYIAVMLFYVRSIESQDDSVLAAQLKIGCFAKTGEEAYALGLLLVSSEQLQNNAGELDDIGDFDDFFSKPKVDGGSGGGVAPPHHSLDRVDSRASSVAHPSRTRSEVLRQISVARFRAS